MFARSVSFRLKPDSIAAFTELIEDETLPLLRKQKGFEERSYTVRSGRPGRCWNQLVGSERKRGSL